MGGVVHWIYAPLAGLLPYELLAIGAAAFCGAVTYGGVMLATGGLEERGHRQNSLYRSPMGKTRVVLDL